MEVIDDSENKLLGRRELEVKFTAGAGILSRQAAVEAIASKIGVKKENVSVISIKGAFGTRDVKARAYVFPKPELAKQQLSGYVSMRHLPKDERKKIRDERRKGAAAAPSSAPPSEAPTTEKKS
jgi:ribosomal protein S24E